MITLTEQAAQHVSKFLAKRGKGIGIRLGVKTSGCSGMAYKLEFADAAEAEDMVFESHKPREKRLGNLREIEIHEEHHGVSRGPLLDHRRQRRGGRQRGIRQGDLTREFLLAAYGRIGKRRAQKRRELRPGQGGDFEGVHRAAAEALVRARRERQKGGEKQRKEGTPHLYIRNTPKRVSRRGPFAAAARPKARTRRVSTGSRIPSSHRRPVAK